MWRNPKHYPPAGADPPAPSSEPAPPRETGERLATFERGQGAELRVNLDEYNGHPYVSLRLWERGRDGVWRPTKKGCTIRMGDLPELLEALGRVATQGRPGGRLPSEGVPSEGGVRDAHPSGAAGSGRFTLRPAQQRRSDSGNAPAPSHAPPWDPGFDEFAGPDPVA